MDDSKWPLQSTDHCVILGGSTTLVSELQYKKSHGMGPTRPYPYHVALTLLVDVQESPKLSLLMAVLVAVSGFQRGEALALAVC